MPATLTPGVYFESRPPALPTVLPRMDIAAFVGFAATGPLDTPVVIEDPAGFNEIFGDDLDLAWDPLDGRITQAYLGPSVRAFLRNGGRRCWVVRVAGRAATADFLLPGVLSWSAVRGFAGARCTARSAGSWADRLRINTAATERATAAGDARATDLVRVRVAGTDLIGFRTPDGSVLWFRPVAATELLPAVTAVAWLGAYDPVALAIADVTWEQSALDVRLSAPAPGVAPGTWLSLTTAAGTLLACVEEVNGARLRTARVWWHVPETPAAAAGTARQLSVLELSIAAELGEGARRQLDGLGMVPGHPRYVGALPDDAEVFSRGAPADSPRFPLACHSDRLFVPLGVVTPVDDRFAGTALPSGLTRLERDGLASFDAAVFLDPSLERYSVSTLLDAAFHRQHELEPPASLRGLHALLPVEEVSIVGIPDGVHRPWVTLPAGDAPPEPPVLAPVFVEGETVRLEWSGVPGARAYQLQSSIDPAFSRTSWQRDLTTTHDEDALEDPACGTDRWYRVRAVGAWGITPWSNTEAAAAGLGGYDECDRRLAAAPLLAPPLVNEQVTLDWEYGDAAAFELEASPEPAFAAASRIYAGPETRFSYWQQPWHTQYYRVRAHGGPWSNTVAVAAQGTTQVVQAAAARDGDEPAAHLAALERLHAALLIFCAARSDAFAILSLPRHFRERSGRRLRDQLTGSALIANDERTLSFGACYHPWIVARDSELRTVPPDGAAAGVMAARTLARGAWAAPANRLVAGAIALEPAGLDPALRYGERFNIVEQTPGGFLVLNADTLATDIEFRTIGTRRLVILMRRLALREGTRFVFEPNDARLARRIQRQFEEVMAFLYARGAFAGATNDQAYRVIVGASTADNEQGRLYIELRFAPAEPLAFLTVRLVDAGGTWVVTEAG